MERLDAIMAVMEAAFDPYYREAWNRNQVADALTLPNTHALLIDSDSRIVETPEGEIAGFSLSRHVLDEEELLLIAIAPRFRGQGIGARLLAAQIAAARARDCSTLFLEMRAGNPAETLYARSGFEQIGTRRDYYTCSDGRKLDAQTFALPLKDG